MLPFLQKIICRYNYRNLHDMIYGYWDIEQNILKYVILGHFLLFYPLKTPKIKILKTEKIYWKYHHFTNVYQKSQSNDVQFLRYGVRQTEFFVILGHFLPFHHPPTLMIPKIKILKKMKMAGDIILFTFFYPFIHPET